MYESAQNISTQADNTEQITPSTQHDSTTSITISKRQMKRQERQKRWEATSGERRDRRKMKKKILRARWKQEGKKRSPTFKMADSNYKYTVVFDYAFEHVMADQLIRRCGKQLMRAYGMNRRIENPIQLHVCSFNGRIEEYMKSKMMKFEAWDINVHKENILEIFPKERLVYLTSDSPNVLTKLEEGDIYIIGALIDRNKHKGLTYEFAVDSGIKHAKLPIADYLPLSSKTVLPTTHVFEILIKISEGNSWKDVLSVTIPNRIKKNCTTGIPISLSDETESENDETPSVDE